MPAVQPSPHPSPEEAQILSQFADIVLPTEVSIWPFTWQLWLLLLLSICVLASVYAFVFHLHRRVKNNAYRKVALRRIGDLKKSMDEDTIKHEQGLAKINEVIKSCLILAGYKKKTFMSLHSEPWYRYLISTVSKNQQAKLSSFDSHFISWGKFSYRGTAVPADELKLFLEFASTWIKYHQSANKEQENKNKIEETHLEKNQKLQDTAATYHAGGQADV